jgi:hypothetical protein
MEYREIMHEAARVFNDRNTGYGDMKVGIANAAQLATIITGIHLSAHDVALVLHAVKLSRLNTDRRNPDHYIDGVNYLAFAGELIEPLPLAGDVDAVLNGIDKEFATLAEQFAASNPTGTPHQS